MAADPERGDVLLFGGRGADGVVRGDCWVWRASAWAEVSGGPPARRAAVMAFHQASRRVLLFGGYDAAGAVLGDTWEWDGASWTERGLGPSPAARAAAAMAADAGTGELLLFGGIDAAGTTLGDTWRFDGNGWAPVSSTQNPAPRFGHGLAADPVGGGVLMFGGVGVLPLTWGFSGGSWSVRGSAVDPGPRARHLLVEDPLRGRVVLHGGTDGLAYALDDTWEWDGVTWIPRAPVQAPPPRIGAAIAFGPADGRSLVFGGFDGVRMLGDTWSYGPDSPAGLAQFGAGCPGSGGVPTIRSASGLPWLGDAFEVAVEGLPSSGAVFVHAGLSDSVWGATSLPLALGALGMPGCWLLTSADAAVVVVNRGGTAGLSLQVPGDPALRGMRIFLQALAVDPGANPLGAITSDGLALTLGAR